MNLLYQITYRDAHGNKTIPYDVYVLHGSTYQDMNINGIKKVLHKMNRLQIPYGGLKKKRKMNRPYQDHLTKKMSRIANL